MSTAPVKTVKEELVDELTGIRAATDKAFNALETQFRDLKAHFDGRAATDTETSAAVKKHSTDYAQLATEFQALRGAVDTVKRQLDAPINNGGADLKDNDRKAAIELQRRAHYHKHGNDDAFRADLDNLVNLDDVRGAVRKWMKVGPISRDDAKRLMTDGEKRAFEAASLADGMFSPEVLGYIQDCTILPANMLDLYGVLNVSKSRFQFLNVKDYAVIGQYDCDAKCDAELGPAGNMVWLEGKVYDFRGAFCLQKRTIQEANVDILGHMMYSAQRSHFINRNRASIVGDGINEPMGWLTKDCFPKFGTQAPAAFNHVDYRRFVSTHPVERGRATAVMHQNIFGYLAAMTDNTGRFLFGEGEMTFSPDDVQERIRICNWLPDATVGGTKGSAAAPFTAGDFLVAVGAWQDAYKTVNKKPMFMEQYVGGSSAWCVKYQFGAEDGGDVACCDAARILTVQ